MRDQGIEVLRFVAATAIVAWHIPSIPSGLWVSWSLPAFVAISILYGRRRVGVPRRQFLRNLGVRLLVPWLIWSLGYVIARAVSHLDDLSAWVSQFSLSDLLIGGVLPLWYLPFMFALLALDGLLRFERFEETCTRRPSITFFLPSAYVLLAVGWLVFSKRLEAGAEPWPQYNAVLPGALVLLACLEIRGRGAWIWRIGIVGCTAAIATWFQYSIFPAAIGMGLALSLVGHWRGMNKAPRWLGQASWPMYLVHPLFIGIFYKLQIAAEWVFILSISLSVGAAWLLLRSDALRSVLLEGRLLPRSGATA